MQSADNLGYNWQWYRIPRYLFSYTETGIVVGPLVEGLKITLQISLISLVFALFIGLTTAIFRLSNSFVARWLAVIYLETSRNTPLLIQIFFIYFVLGPMLGLERMFSAILALSLFEGAYASEIFRSGIQSVDRGQIEAASSLGSDHLFHLSPYHHSPGNPDGTPATYQPGNFPGKRLCTRKHYRDLRPNHARPNPHRRDISHFRDLVYGGGNVPFNYIIFIRSCWHNGKTS